MQASKIKPHTIYAIKCGNDFLRFRVTAVVTRRTEDYGNPRDYKSTVEGYSMEPGDSRETITKKPEDILGEFTEFTELVARNAKERAERERQENEARDRQLKVRELLYEFVGSSKPMADPTGYDQTFKLSYNGIDINTNGIELLLAAFERQKVRA